MHENKPMLENYLFYSVSVTDAIDIFFQYFIWSKSEMKHTNLQYIGILVTMLIC